MTNAISQQLASQARAQDLTSQGAKSSAPLESVAQSSNPNLLNRPYSLLAGVASQSRLGSFHHSVSHQILPNVAGTLSLVNEISSVGLPDVILGSSPGSQSASYDVMVIGPRAQELAYNVRSGAFDDLVYADVRDEIARDTRCGKKLREYWWVMNLTVRTNPPPPVFWVLVFRVVIYERCVEVFVGGGRWVGGKVVPDPALPTIPLWDVPWVEIKTPGGHFVRMGVIVFRRGDMIIAGPGNGVGPATERSGGFIVIESDCPNWTHHRFKKGSAVIKWVISNPCG